METLAFRILVKAERQGRFGIDRLKAPEMALEMNNDIRVNNFPFTHRGEDVGPLHQVIDIEIVMTKDLHPLGRNLDPKMRNPLAGEEPVGFRGCGIGSGQDVAGETDPPNHDQQLSFKESPAQTDHWHALLDGETGVKSQIVKPCQIPAK